MSTIEQYFMQSELAQAAYGTFSIGPIDVNALTSNDVGMSQTQAEKFAAKWSVIDQIGDTANGFSATIFKNNLTGKYTLAIRGSTDLADFDVVRGIIIDDGIAAPQLVDLYNFWQRANTSTGMAYNAARLTRVSEGTAGAMFIRGAYYICETISSVNLADPTLRFGTGALTTCPASIEVVGHSLGGHLAMAFSRLFPSISTDVLAVNGLGFTIGGTTVNNLFAQLAGATSFNSASIDNVYGIAGPEFAAMNNFALQQPGGWDGIYIESTSPLPPASLGHGAAQMTDSLAIYSLYAKLSPALQLGAITSMIESASSESLKSLESTLDALRTLLIDGDIATNLAKQTATGDRNAFYTNLYALQNSAGYTALKGSAGLALLAGQGASTLSTQGKTDFGTFLALDYLLPFALTDASSVLIPTHQTRYDAWQADQSLTPEQKRAGEANYSDAWYADRAAMLVNVLDANAADTGAGRALRVDTHDTELLYFEDKASGLSVQQVNAVAPSSAGPSYIFGGAQDDTLAGSAQRDHLYGGLGDDALKRDKQFPAYHFRHIDMSWLRRYPAATPEPCAHGPSNSRNERERAAAFPAAARIVLESGTVKPAKHNSFAKVSRGGTPSNGTWRRVA